MKKQKLEKGGSWEAYFFDEVKIKEGLVFNPSTFELVGFTDLDDDEIEVPSIGQLKESDSKPENTLATHVLQFYFPCAFLLTRGVINCSETEHTFLARSKHFARIFFFF